MKELEVSILRARTIYKWKMIWSLLIVIALVLLVNHPVSAAGSFSLFAPKQQGIFKSPENVAVDGDGNMYVADTNNHRIQKFDSNGHYVLQWGGYGNGEGKLSFPAGIAVDEDGNVYVAEKGNNRIQKFDGKGRYLLQMSNLYLSSPNDVAVDGEGNVFVAVTNAHHIQKFDSAGQYLTQWGMLGNESGQFYYPRGVAVDESGNVYVADDFNNRIQKFDGVGRYLTQWGNIGEGPGQLQSPSDVEVDSAGNVYVVDRSNHRIQIFSHDGEYMDQWGGHGSAKGQFYNPLGVALDNSGNVYIADTDNHRIQKINHSGQFLMQWRKSGSGAGEFAIPSGLAVDRDGRLYVADTNNHVIQIFDRSGDYISQLGGYGIDDHQFTFVSDVEVDDSGNIYAVDMYSSSIKKFDSSGQFVTKWGTMGNGAGQLNLPQGAAIDASGNIYVADSMNHRIQKFDSSGQYLMQWGSYGNGNGQLHYPSDAAVDADGNVYVADYQNHRIQKFDSDGQYLMQWGGAGSEAGKFNYPNTLAIDKIGDVYVVDSNNHRIQKFDGEGQYLTEWGSNGSQIGEFKLPQGIAVDGNGSLFIADADNSRIQVLYQVLFNKAPTASNVGIVGIPIAGDTLTGHYSYADAENDAEGASQYQWYISDDALGTNRSTINGGTALTVQLTHEQVDKYITFEVTPVALTGMKTGVAAQSPPLYFPRTYKIRYDGNGAESGSVPADNYNYEQGDQVIILGNNGSLTKKGYTFAGWNTLVDGSGEDYLEGSQLTIAIEDITLYAKWLVNNYMVKFESNGGTVVDSQSVKYNEMANKPAVPTKTGHMFVGWYSDKDMTSPYDFNTLITEDMVLYAKWSVNSYTVNFESNGGTTVDSQTVEYNEVLSKPVVPTKAGYTFAGWYKDVNFTKSWNFNSDVVISNTILYAKWLVNSSSSSGGEGSINPDTTPEKPLPEQPTPKPKPEPAEPLQSTPQPEREITFSDVPQDYWAWAMIQEMAKHGIITGYQDGTFKPNAPIQRQHVALMLTRALVLERKKEVVAFSDIPKTHLYFEEIKQVQQAGLFVGIDGNFEPIKNMTRAQMAKVLVLSFNLTSTTKDTFSDVPITHWAHGSIAVLAANGITIKDNGYFRPNDPVTRAEFATFLYRALQQ